MSSDGSLALAFATGLLGAAHCLGMCSGIAGGFFVRRAATGAWIRPVLLFHGMRILVYTVLGAGGAALGRVFVQVGWIGKGQGVLMILAGTLILMLGLVLLASPLGRRDERTETRCSNMAVRFRVSPSRSWTPVLMGTLNGFVPCSLVFSVAARAVASADPLSAVLQMLAFGMGTLPAMVVVSLIGSAIGWRVRDLGARLAGLAVVALGLWTIYEGAVFVDVMWGLGNW